MKGPVCIWNMAAQESEKCKLWGPDSALEGSTAEKKRPGMDGWNGPAMHSATLRTDSPWALCPTALSSHIFCRGGSHFVGAVFV